MRQQQQQQQHKQRHHEKQEEPPGQMRQPGREGPAREALSNERGGKAHPSSSPGRAEALSSSSAPGNREDDGLPPGGKERSDVGEEREAYFSSLGAGSRALLAAPAAAPTASSLPLAEQQQQQVQVRHAEESEELRGPPLACWTSLHPLRSLRFPLRPLPFLPRSSQPLGSSSSSSSSPSRSMWSSLAAPRPPFRSARPRSWCMRAPSRSRARMQLRRSPRPRKRSRARASGAAGRSR
jgi:hypothetical protein